MLRAADRQNLEILHFIFHPILKEGDEGYFDELDLSEVGNDFFTAWFANSLTHAIEYEFVNRDNDDSLYTRATQIRDGAEDFFVETSKQITDLFKRFHKGSMSDGVLAVALGRVPSGHLLFLVKTNFEHVMAYDEEEHDGRRVAKLRKIPHPISEDRAAIQKVAIVNIDSDNEWEVLAQDRQISSANKIADFFKNYLDVREREVASVLTRKVFSAVREWVHSNRDHIDPGQTPPHYTGRAFDYLNSHNEFDTQQFIDSVVFDPDEERRRELRGSLRRSLAEKELADRAFEPKPKSIQREAKTTYKTSTGVQIIFTGDPEGHNISVVTEGNEKVITIRTPALQEF